MITTETKPRIYVACLASYNAGILHGAWFDASTDVDEMQAAIDAVIESSPVGDAEEWAFHDYEGLGQLEEYSSLERIAEALQAYEEHGQGAVEAYISNHGEWNESAFMNSYVGQVDNYQRDKTEWLVEQFMACLHLTGEDREFFEKWADWDKIARTMDYDYTFVSGADNTAYIFRDC